MTALASVRDVAGAIDAVAHASSLLVVVDFESALAVEPGNPERGASPTALEALEALTQSDETRVAVVSGLPLEDLRASSWPPGLEVIGSYGFEWSSLFSIGLSRPASARLHRLCQAVQQVAQTSGIEVEPKPFGVVVRYRDLDPVIRSRLVDELAKVAASIDQIHVRASAQEDELSIAPLTNAWVIDVLRQQQVHPPTILYVGDGIDRDALEALDPGDLAVLVHHSPSGVAIVQSGEPVPEMLSQLVTLRRAALA